MKKKGLLHRTHLLLKLNLYTSENKSPSEWEAAGRTDTACSVVWHHTRSAVNLRWALFTQASTTTSLGLLSSLQCPVLSASGCTYSSIPDPQRDEQQSDSRGGEKNQKMQMETPFPSETKHWSHWESHTSVLGILPVYLTNYKKVGKKRLYFFNSCAYC